MNNTQPFFSIGVPTLAVFLAWLNSNHRFNQADAKVEAFRSELNAKVEALRLEVKGDIGSLREEIRADLRLLNSIVIDFSQRIAKLEAKPQR